MKDNTKKCVGNFIYKTSDVLGVGTWGTVYKGISKDQSDKNYYAIKKMNKFRIQASQKSLEKYQSEVLVLQKAENIPQIIKIVDFFKTKSSYYIITEYLQNSVDLYEYMLQNDCKFCEAEARLIWRDLLNGIKSLHQLKIYHRDLKLQNILYIPQKCAKIIDFGTATLFQNNEGYVGSPMLMSPQAINNEKYTYKSDIWSLGIIFYCMIFHFPPYGDTYNVNDIKQKMKIIQKEGIQYPHGIYISEGCRQVIESCLQYQQEKRKQIHEILSLQFFKKKKLPTFKPELFFCQEGDDEFKT